MVLVFLDSLRFEASRFETRTMPTPDLKGKEIIYWIKVETVDRRLAVDLHRFLKGAPKTIELRVPSAFIVAMTELETFWPQVLDIEVGEARSSIQSDQKRVDSEKSGSSTGKLLPARADSRARSGEAAWELNENQLGGSKKYVVEIVLRRAVSSSSSTRQQSQSPYG